MDPPPPHYTADPPYPFIAIATGSRMSAMMVTRCAPSPVDAPPAAASPDEKERSAAAMLSVGCGWLAVGWRLGWFLSKPSAHPPSSTHTPKRTHKQQTQKSAPRAPPDRDAHVQPGEERPLVGEERLGLDPHHGGAGRARLGGARGAEPLVPPGVAGGGSGGAGGAEACVVQGWAGGCWGRVGGCLYDACAGGTVRHSPHPPSHPVSPLLPAAVPSAHATKTHP